MSIVRLNEKLKNYSFFFVKQQTAYERRISDWSSDVCSSDLLPSSLAAEPATRDALPGDVGSDVLLRRPDVLRAEHLLIAENANIGAARAAFFPAISLTGTIGTLSSALSGLFKDGSYTYSAGPSEIGRASCRERVGQYG